jgi:dinuclear metal center YbgI/SA1388 family protein
MISVQDILSHLEQQAPFRSQEDYDNSGLLIGTLDVEVKGILVCLDCTEEVVYEAIRLGSNLIVSHHPLIFRGIKSLTGKNYVERTLMLCLKNNINLISIHTNLDNAFLGVNAEIGRRIGLKNLQILDPKSQVLLKLEVYVPKDNLEHLKNALFAAGAGSIGNYNECGFFIEGTGTFKPKSGANPSVGVINELSSVDEIKAEFILSKHIQQKVLYAMFSSHPYEEVAYNLIPVVNKNQTEGAGMIGELELEMDEKEFLEHIKDVFNCQVIRHTEFIGKPMKNVAFCGGAGDFLLPVAKAKNADIFITSDIKYHQFFDAEQQILIADIGHYESEQFTSNLIIELIKKKFTNFAVHLTGINTNPINYF